MASLDVRGATIASLAESVRSRKVKARDLTEAYLDRVARLDGAINSYLTVTGDAARRQADAVDKALDGGDAVGPLAGVPIALKDIFVTKGVETTCASKILRGFIPPFESTVSDRLAKAGTIMLGKLNMDEFAMGSSNENSSRGPVRNPWSLAHVPGGSSGGSAAAVAASLCAGSLGTDTGGSIRQPAALCGVVGIKPTYGRVSRYGVIAFASSLDHPGPFGRTVDDVATLLEIMAGNDPRDATSVPAPVGQYRAAVKAGAAAGGVKGMRIGVPAEYFGAGMDPEIESTVRAAIDELGRAGATIVPVSLPHTKYAIATYYLICTAEAASNLARYDGVKYGYRAADAKSLEELYTRTRGEGFGREPKRRIMLGTYVLRSGYYDAYYGQALKARRMVFDDFQKVFADEKCDAIVTPTSPIPAFRFGEKTSDPLQMYLADVMTVAANLAGVPALSQCCGFTKAGLPVGLQVMGAPLREDLVFRVAGAYEARTDWHRRLPTDPTEGVKP
ncbi:MAG TPA: Asp-tRNA(Asn)/Glu-tRNA(Gln) amidotransferase subunit GatA [Polyangia bacterium]|nr:Asp-tRNA(Asn)/Glu-tRNA(Gln) amidotransferase subunit GatA [Polyangia bacterium]